MLQVLLKCLGSSQQLHIIKGYWFTLVDFVLCFGCFGSFHLYSMTLEKRAVIFKLSSGQDPASWQMSSLSETKTSALQST